MKSRYNTSRGIAIDLADIVGEGGEGSVFGLSDPRIVAKVYHDPISSLKAKKLRWMADNCSDQLLKTSAWVLDTLHDRKNGSIVGFVMPLVAAKEVHELYSPKSRRLYFPRADWRFLIQTAKNLAVAFSNLHSAGHVVGDVNQGNVVVLPDTTVKLIDCDSYQLTIEGTVYPCEVGVTTHIPPELQGVSLNKVVRTQNHDAFGLAVLIFQLLFLGRHPYAGNFIGAHDKTLDDSIREYRFAYGAGASQRQVRQPPGTLPLESLNAATVGLFERAFLPNQRRPVAADWLSSLDELFNGLVQCPAQISHHYFKAQRACPWCEIERLSNSPVFPILTSTGTAKGFDLTSIESLLRSIGATSAHGSLPVRGKNLPQPAPEITETRSRIRSGVLFTTVLHSIGLTVAVITAGPGRALIGSILVVGLVFAWMLRLSRNSHKTAYSEYQLMRARWEVLVESWRVLGESFVERQRSAEIINEGIKRYKQLGNKRLERLKQLEQNAYKHQLNNYLDAYPIGRANIQGIGWKKSQLLQSFGIDSAADIDQRRILRIPGFGPANTAKLTEWRASLERRFTFNRATGVPKQEIQKLEHECANSRMQAEAVLLASTANLQSANSTYSQKKALLEKQAAGLVHELNQSQANAAATSLITLPFAVLVVIAFTIPFISLVERLVARDLVVAPLLAPATVSPSPIPPATPSMILTGNSNVSSTPIPSNSMAEIAKLTDLEKQTKADELYDRGVSFTRSNKFVDAEKVYAEALLYSPQNLKVLHELGYARYRLKKYSSAIDVLQKAAKIDSGGQEPEIRKVLGKAYFAAEKWAEAAALYKVLSAENPTDFDFQFQLGVSSKKSGDLAVAAAALEKASGIQYSDSRAHFELAEVYLAQGRISDAESEAQILKVLDATLARQIIDRLNN